MAAAEVDLEMEDLFEDGNIDEDIDGQQALTDDANNEETPQAEDDQGLSILVQKQRCMTMSLATQVTCAIYFLSNQRHIYPYEGKVKQS